MLGNQCKFITFLGVLKHCSLAGISGKCLQNIQYRYRTKATDDSFVKARENLVKEVENSRQQKIKALEYQLKSASLIKDERNTKARNFYFDELRNSKRNSLSGPPSKMPKISVEKSVQRHGNLSSTSPELITNSLVNIKAKVSDKSDKQKVTHTSGTADVNDVEKFIYNKCLSAVQRRNALEQRLREAYTNTDEFVRAEEIEIVNKFTLHKHIQIHFLVVLALRHWFREGFRGTVYLGVPLLMLILGNMPSTPEYIHNMVRDRYLKSTGIIGFDLKNMNKFIRLQRDSLCLNIAIFMHDSCLVLISPNDKVLKHMNINEGYYVIL
uniref:Uncharacterized protein n=1 Tax=Schistosoma haematobium TaxID=6185 RepID=A0A095A4R7_SCHHA